MGSVTRSYDAEGRQSSQTDWKSNTATFTYNADDQLTSGTAPTTAAPVVDSYTYNPADVITGINTAQGSTTLASFSYTNDNANQTTAVTSTGVPADNHTYSYNSLNQLTGVDTSKYTYNPPDDPTQLEPNTTQSFDPADQLTNQNAAAPGIRAVQSATTNYTTTQPVLYHRHPASQRDRR